MPGMLLHIGALVQCQHGGSALPLTSVPRVKVSGQPIVLQSISHTIVGCSFLPPNGNGPCVSAQWLTGATRIKANGIPVLLSDSQALCMPTSTGLTMSQIQTRVKGQ
jgi:hypothetical protein